MDDIVKKAMQKWPNVPHCYGWLALDHRGTWRMRDAAAQAQGLPGDKIAHAALIAFIVRNYTHDDKGNWYFQNGPQRVYVDLAIAPFIAHTDPASGFVLHTGEVLSTLTGAAMTPSGTLFLQSADKVAAVNDLDMGVCVEWLQSGNQPVQEAFLLAWLDKADTPGDLVLAIPGRHPVRVHRLDCPPDAYFGFQCTPRSPG